jgi:hypothetical protein
MIMNAQNKTPDLSVKGLSNTLEHSLVFDNNSITLLNNALQLLEKTLVENGKYLNPKTTYITTDSEWKALVDWVPGFKEWCQGSCLVIEYKENKWVYEIVLVTTIKLDLTAIEKIKETFRRHPSIRLHWQDSPKMMDFVKAQSKEVVVINKYSPLDFHAYFGEDIWLDAVDKGVIEQKRCLRFNNKFAKFSKRKYEIDETHYQLRDLQGLNQGNLKKQAESVGVELQAKDTMNDYKLNILEGLNKLPLTATVYNLCDTIDTFRITLTYVPLVNKIVKSLGLPDDCLFNFDGLPHTTGTLVGKVFEDFIYYYPYIINNDCTTEELFTWQIALSKHALMSEKLTDKDRLTALFIMRKYAENHCFKDFDNDSEKHNKKTILELIGDRNLMRRLFGYNIYQQACAKMFGTSFNDSGVFGALVQGGRCNNENPYEYFKQTVADIDMASCYGSTLRTLKYPIGLPTINSICDLSGESRKNFGKVHESVKNDLIDNLYVYDVSTKSNLSFNQDLIFSSAHVSVEKIKQAVTGESHYTDDEGYSMTEEHDIKKIPNTFCLLRKQLIHAKLTSSSIAVLDNVPTSREKADFRKQVELDVLVYYPKSKQFDCPIAWSKHILKDSGSIHKDKKNNTIDSRSKAWFGIDLNLFSGNLVDQRKAIKREMKTVSKTSTHYNPLNASQEMFKLFVNTLYGVLASVYFNFGNTVLANVITDKARVGAWMMSKPLAGFQTITDGCQYSPIEVRFNLGKKLPGLDTLSDPRNWKSKDISRDINRSVGTLGNRGELFWDDYISRCLSNGTSKEDEILLDTDALNHVNEFWKPYKLKFEFGVEHKYKHTDVSVGYMGKSDYVFKHSDPKKRGARPTKDDNGNFIDPGFKMLQCLAVNSMKGYDHLPYTSSHIVKVGEYSKAKRTGEPVGNPQTLAERKTANNVVPGWSFTTQHPPRQINNTHFPNRDLKHLEKKTGRKGFIKGVRQEWFEKYIDNPSQMIKVMERDNLN